MRIRFFENAFSVAKSKVDREKSVINNVKILGPHSKNGYRYSDEAINRARPLYEGARVFINHPPQDQRRPSIDRNLGDRWGFIESPTVVKARGQIGLFGNLRYNPKHALTETLLWTAENAPDSIGLSHVADGKWLMEGAERVVKEIEKVYSVDVVDRAATTAGLFESWDDQDKGPTMGFEFKDLTIDQIKKERLDLYESIGREATAQFSEAIRKRTDLINAAAEEFKLDPKYRTGAIWESLRTVPESQIKPMVEQMAKTFKTSAGSDRGGFIHAEEGFAGRDGGDVDDDDRGGSSRFEESDQFWGSVRNGQFV